MFKYRRQSFLCAKPLLNITDRPATDQQNSYSLWFNTMKKWKIIKKPSNVSVKANSRKHLPVTIHKQSYQNIGRLKVTLRFPHTVDSQFGERFISVWQKWSYYRAHFTTKLHLFIRPWLFPSLYLTWMYMIIVSVMMSLTLQVSGAVLSTLHLHARSCLIPRASTWVSTILSQIVAVEIKA